MSLQPSRLLLHGRLISSCSARVRIAASLKNIPLELKEYGLKGEARKFWQDQDYLRKNPNAALPTLEAYYEQGRPLILTQSLSMLDFLEETYPDSRPLMPPVTDMAARCKVRDLALLVAADLQPLQTLRIFNLLRGLPLLAKEENRFTDKSTVDGSTSLFDMKFLRKTWIQKTAVRCMKAYEAIAEKSAGRFSVGDNVSIADVCLVAMVQSLRGLHLDFKASLGYPTIERIKRNCENIDAFRLQGVHPWGPKEGESHENPLESQPDLTQEIPIESRNEAAV